MLCFPNAKINIGLNIINKRPDGYHNIETLFCPVGLYDILEFIPDPGQPGGRIELNITGIPVAGQKSSNLVVKAYQLLHHQFSLPAVKVHLHKIIPYGAGLGGGSSDGAFMLRYLNEHFMLGLDDDRLQRFASELGSDCAFFIKNKPVFAHGRGDQFMPITALPEFSQIVIIHPPVHVNTKDAYESIHPSKPDASINELMNRPLNEWKNTIVNDFEKTVTKMHPVIAEIKNTLYASGAAYAAMSGSGSSVYGIFTAEMPNAHQIFPEFFCWTGSSV